MLNKAKQYFPEVRTDLADALEQAISEQQNESVEAALVHHSDRGAQYLQYLLTRYTEPYDNALAESVIGLFKTEVIHRRGPWRSVEDIEFATLEWVWWFNYHRLCSPEPASVQRDLVRAHAEL